MFPKVLLSSHVPGAAPSDPGGRSQWQWYRVSHLGSASGATCQNPPCSQDIQLFLLDLSVESYMHVH